MRRYVAKARQSIPPPPAGLCQRHFPFSPHSKTLFSCWRKNACRSEMSGCFHRPFSLQVLTQSMPTCFPKSKSSSRLVARGFEFCMLLTPHSRREVFLNVYTVSEDGVARKHLFFLFDNRGTVASRTHAWGFLTWIPVTLQCTAQCRQGGAGQGEVSITSTFSLYTRKTPSVWPNTRTFRVKPGPWKNNQNCITHESQMVLLVHVKIQLETSCCHFLYFARCVWTSVNNAFNWPLPGPELNPRSQKCQRHPKDSCDIFKGWRLCIVARVNPKQSSNLLASRYRRDRTSCSWRPTQAKARAGQVLQQPAWLFLFVGEALARAAHARQALGRGCCGWGPGFSRLFLQ